MTIIQGDARAMDLDRFQRYGVIVADPPWPYRVGYRRAAAARHYDLMTMDEIWQMPVCDLSLPDSILLLWGTWPKLPEAVNTIAAWGFEYVTGFPWIKMTKGRGINYGVGYWVRGCSEFVFIARKGTVSPPSIEGYLGLMSPNLQHSRKPDSIHVIAESLPGPYLELFARRPRDGWDTFGNEVKADVASLPMFSGVTAR